MAGRLVKYTKRAEIDTYDIHYYNGVWLGVLYKEVDGYYVWWDKSNRGGSYESEVLKEIAAILDELNYEWDKELKQFFANEMAKDHEANQQGMCTICGFYKDTPNHEFGCKPWPGYCQNCKAELNPPNATYCNSCGASDIDDD